jgi:hypothetical protein
MVGNSQNRPTLWNPPQVAVRHPQSNAHFVQKGFKPWPGFGGMDAVVELLNLSERKESFRNSATVFEKRARLLSLSQVLEK